MFWILAAIVGVLVADEEHSNRIAEEQRFRSELTRLRALLAAKEAQLTDIETRYGRLSQQYRMLAAEVESLRNQINLQAA
jgi:uncharacterized protein involved in exopolysaccharide biosynthesis